MSIAPLRQVLAGNRYPGRGVLWARTLDGALHGGYFLTGRSAASQARRLMRRDAELIVAATGAAAHDPLRHYVAARERGGWLVFGNGEQVAAVADRLEAGQPAGREALLAEVWDALTPQLRVAAAVFAPGQLADAAIRNTSPR
ncbi:IMP cyclohydrolase [Candidatus Frankia alpina]|uniref:Inosine monophosphate cyclohydrolase-like domain-containing protein n=1 Tax=Candidatus Frankia alpina TaxID=2699483 RepID=A0A4S5EBQ1_9ACTN|nr:IMP cyclohydrolase [Candidatus Frankia alpina]THJ69082.1 hypothetical protein E7Y31_16525 [Candidatus Frankia alpina]